jgi:hypothetical protein
MIHQSNQTGQHMPISPRFSEPKDVSEPCWYNLKQSIISRCGVENIGIATGFYVLIFGIFSCTSWFSTNFTNRPNTDGFRAIVVRHRFDTDPDPTSILMTDPDPILPQIFTFIQRSFSPLLYFSRQRQRCDNFQCFEQSVFSAVLE